MFCNSYGLTPSRTSLGLSLLPSSSQFRPDPCPLLFFPLSHFNPRLRIAPIRVRSKLNDLSTVTESSSFYDLLGISQTVSQTEIKQAYKQLARKYHPDVSPPDRVEDYTQRFIRVQEAYETLSDPGRRSLYDRDMSKGLIFALSARRRNRRDEPMVEKSEWRIRWKSQLSELKRRSMYKNSNDITAWGARMRMQTHEASS